VISVIVATHNRRPLLERTLAALDRQKLTGSALEVLVVDNGSTDGTLDWIRARRPEGDGPALTVLHESRPGKSYAVNRGVAEARGEILLFTDDDVVPEPGWAHALATAMRQTASDFAVGRILPLWEAPPPAWLSPALYGVLAVPDNGASRLHISQGCNEHVMPIGANMAVRASVVKRLGGWRADLGKLRDTLRSGEDHEFYLRMLAANLRGVYEPSALVRHLVPASRLTRRYFRRWMHDNGRIVAALGATAPKAVPHLLGVPRYLWAAAVRDGGSLLASAARRDPAAGFSAAARLLWFAGYLRGAWQPERSRVAAQAATPSRQPEAAGALQEQ
jgi:glucosyl-dolichyl phosphate glucuronosyltransferase